ncbi:DUF4329 domain-containing protein [Pseudomonas moraviensis subsp. stanleyae]|uniref:DUF4329 domain-containing protein n=1 Tax=Pseudomonas moraviensis TaxID=321662 RepID=UPI002E333E65|nr:DUF4329 domain-containing protein [Pseudomonas moraviensis]MED7665649.1 DUF4329 domain-containing protein [Pseudomonas moraviensis subsp. stanleyae]
MYHSWRKPTAHTQALIRFSAQVFMSHVSGRSGRTASSSATFKLPPLSPAFLTEEDAAYWVHTRVPPNPDKEYGSVILLRPDGKFLATSPVAGQATGFDFGTIVQTDVLGGMLHPLGYRCIASVHSHPPIHAEFRNGNRRQDETLLRLFMSFYSGGDFIGDVSAREFFRSAYLSGPDGSLLKYVSSGSPEERDYFLWQQSGGPTGHPAGAYDVMAVINKLASVGELKVIVSNADWGHSVGRVPAQWKAGSPFSTGAVTELPLMTRVCVNAERAVLAALKSRGAHTTGLILKKLTGEEYVATHARPAGPAAWDPERIFPVDAQGQLQLPRGYLLEGFYFASRPDPAQFPPGQPWLYENFFTPREIAQAIEANARNKHLAKAGRALSLYMQAQDHAMLKYRFSGDSIEAALSVAHADGTVSDNDVQARLLAGTLAPRAFVSMLVLAGTLEVVRGSALWAHLGPVDLEWQPFANFAWPRLSRPFLSADDAVRHAHELVGIRRDQQYAGYVFQRSDKRFVVTEPLPGDIDTLGQSRLYPMDNHGRPVFPDDHVPHARYVSHVALSHLPPVDAELFGWAHQEAVVSLQMLNVAEVRQVLLDQMALYVCAAPDSLVKYEVHGSDVSRELGRRLGTRQHPGALAFELDSGSKRPQDFIQEQAAAGYLTVLIDNELWGYRGRVPATWSLRTSPSPLPAPPLPALVFPLPGRDQPVLPRPAFLPQPQAPLPPTLLTLPLPWKRVEGVAFGAVFPSADEAAQDRYSRAFRAQSEARAHFGFMLKHTSRQEYVVTELISVSDQDSNPFRLDSMFADLPSAPWHVLPEGFELHGNFYVSARTDDPTKSPHDWLSHYFISPDHLTASMYYGGRRPVIASDVPAVLYIAVRDGALLKYAGSRSSKLFHDASSQSTLDRIKSDLAGGTWLPTDFIHEVANNGDLSVMRTGACWDRTGRVRVTWQPYANLQRRALGPVFLTADDAAVHARTLIPQVAERVYGGLIMETADKHYVATVPIEVSHEDFDAGDICPEESRTYGLFPAGCRIVARYRSRVVREVSLVLAHVQKQVYLNMFSVEVLESAFNKRGVKEEYRVTADGSLVRYKPAPWDEYLFGPDGSVTGYRPQAELVSQLLDQGDRQSVVDAKAIRQRLRDRQLKPIDWVNDLASSGHLWVVTGSEIWGQRRQVAQWTPYSMDLLPGRDYDKALSNPLCSPLFIQADAGARYVHEMALSRDTQTFGYLLSSPEGLFVSTLPVEVQRSTLALDRVFEQGKLLSGFSLNAIYLRAALPPLGARPDDVRHCFLLPNDVQSACARANTPQGFLPIYFSCADGALLKLQLHAFEPGTFYDRFGQIELRANAFVSMAEAAVDERGVASGTFRFADYVHRMAHAGRLEVIETSEYWSRHGQVDENWQPRLPELASAQRWRAHPVPALGPVFHHPDDAACHAHGRVAGQAQIGTGYESAILAQQASLRFVPLEPIVYFANEDNPLLRILRTTADSAVSWHDPAPRYPKGYTLVASHQLHVSGNTTQGADADQVYANFAAPSLVHAHTHAPAEKGLNVLYYYYSTPHDVLLKYTPVYSRAERDLLLTRSVIFEGGRWVSRLSPGEFVSRLIEMGELRVLIGGYYWRQTGRMGNTWRNHRQQSPTPGTVRLRDEL